MFSPHIKNVNYVGVMDVLINLIMVIPSQYICVSDHVIHLTYIQFNLTIIPQ